MGVRTRIATTQIAQRSTPQAPGARGPGSAAQMPPAPRNAAPSQEPGPVPVPEQAPPTRARPRERPRERTPAEPRRIRLAMAEVWPVTSLRSRVVEVLCLEGCLWVTMRGDTRDVLLHAGERLRTRVARKPIVSAASPAALFQVVKPS